MKKLAIIVLAGLLISSCQWSKKKQKSELTLTSIASSEKQWTGVALSQSKRIFVNYPYWSGHVPVSVAEIVNGVPRAYPNMEWNQRTDGQSFNAVQSVFVDDKDRLWVLDTNNPTFKGVQAGGPILFQFDLESNQLIKSHSFPEGVYKSNSYFNDVRIDTHKEVAYI